MRPIGTTRRALIRDPRTKQSVNAYTLRRWCAAHDLHLSDGANPGKDAPRRLTERNIEVLRAVAELRSEGLATDAINAKLATLAFALVDNVDSATSESFDTIKVTPIASPTQAPQDALDGPAMLPTVLQGIDSRFQAIERRSEAQAQEARTTQRERMNMFVTGVLVGAGVVVVIVAVVLATVGSG